MYQIQNKAEDTCEILLYSLIDHGSTALSIINQLKGLKSVKNINIRINSDGGEVFEALAIYNYLKSLKANITVYIDGIAASAATIVACAGKVIMPTNTQMMIHNPFGMVQGDSEELRSLADVLDKIKDSMISIYTEKSGLDKVMIAEMMNNETWLSAQEAYSFGFCDEVIDDSPEEEEDEDEPSGAVEQYLSAIDEHVKAERERIRELDSLMTPERYGILNKAKYETLQSAKDIALELLKIQSRNEDNEELKGIQPLRMSRKHTEEDNIRSVAEIINARRGY